MWRKIFKEVKYHHLLLAFILLSLIFVTAGVFIYWYRPYIGVRTPTFLILLLLLLAVLAWGILLVAASHVSHRDGFWNGYQKGIKDGDKKAKV